MKPEELYRSPNALAPHYRRFRVSERLLLTGHSHQAWPDCAFDGQQQAWLDAAEHADDKWERAFAMADRVRRGFAGLLGDPHGDIALGANTHELVVRLVSALPRRRRRILTTDGEFHTLRRQLDRWEEAGDFRVDRLAAEPAATVGERLAAAVDETTALVAVSRVFFRNAHVAGGLDRLQEACLAAGAELLVDAYHALNVVPVSLAAEGLNAAFVVGGGYKYCQLGEGNCFLRIPPGCSLRPVNTGWFAEFESLASAAPASRKGRGAGAGVGGGDHASGGAAAQEPDVTGGVDGPASAATGEPDGAYGKGESGGAAVEGPDVAGRGRDAVGGEPGAVTYGAGAARFAGATYDPTSHYRAAAIFDFFARQRLAPELLRRVSQHQVGRLAAGFDALDADPRLISRDRETPLEAIGGFLVLRSPLAPAICRSLAARGVRTDSRGETLRMGPAPYLSDRQLDDAIGVLGEVVRGS